MTDAERKTFLELHEVELLAAGEQLARDYHEVFSRSIMEGIQAAIEEFGDKDDEDLLAPALLQRTHEALARLHESTAQLAEYIFFTNLKERYDEKGEA